MPDLPFDPALGIENPLDAWLDFNVRGAFDTPGGEAFIAPFAGEELMRDTTGLTAARDFAAHGATIAAAFAAASPVALRNYRCVLDFGVGAGRLARMFKGFKGRYAGADIDPRAIAYARSALPHVDAVRTFPMRPLPFRDACFDGVFSVSVFTHMDRAAHDFYLAQLARVLQPGGHALITVHGARALERAETEAEVFTMLSVPQQGITAARQALDTGEGFHFILQQGHLTSAAYAYGVTFLSAAFLNRVWSNDFTILAVVSGAIHDFQDIVVLQRR